MDSDHHDIPPGETTDLCPSCKQRYLNKAVKCRGFHNPQNSGRWYQQCPNNDHQDSRLCDGFIWRDDVTGTPRRGTPTEPCAGPLCTDRYKAKPLHQRCVLRFCVECCRYAGNANCRVHHQARPIPAPLLQPALQGVHTILPPFPLDPNMDPTLVPPVSQAPASSYPVSIPAPNSMRANLAPSRPYGKMLSSTYAAKLADTSFAYRSDMESLQQRARYERENQHPVRVYWWNENQQEPLSFMVPVPEYPYFHPAHCETLEQVLGRPACTTYAVYDSSLSTWTITSLAQRVKINTPLLLRSTQVSSCNPEAYIPAAAICSKRAASSSLTSTPKKPKVEEHEVIILSDDDDIEELNETGKQLQLAQVLSEPLSTAAIASESVLCGPRGQRAAWPLRYVCDMAQGFQRMEDARHTTCAKTEDAFKQVFGIQVAWKSSTYSDHVYVWNRAPAESIQAAVAAGRTEAGEWINMVKAYGRRRR